MFNFKNHVPRCDYCNEVFKDNVVEHRESGWGDFHNKCVEEGIKASQTAYKEVMDEWEKEQKEHARYDKDVYRRLVEIAPEDTMVHIDWRIQEDGRGYYDIVDVSKCVGELTTGADFFCDTDCKIRKVYQDVSSDWEGNYGGDVYIHIKGRKYFRMCVGG